MVFAEAEDERVLRATQVVLDEGLATPIVVGRRDRGTASALGLRMQAGRRLHLINPGRPAHREYGQNMTGSPAPRRVAICAQIEMRRRLTLIGAMMIHKGEADGMLCGTYGTHESAPCTTSIRCIGLRKGLQASARR